MGSTEVLYTRRSDAFGAFKKYNNVLLDGKPMKIEIVGANPVVPISARMNVTGANGKKKRTFAMIPGLGGGRGAAVNNRGFGVHSRHQGGGDISTGTRNGRGHAPGRGRGRGKNQPGEKSVDKLDKELESYHAEAMQT
ncbi:RNA AND EXPORT FACTOR BINDING PROTEIN [Salix koriyanagi]|uniref:RNA AND EXPORT FACTOR BINDING PROTEIN n=1 Tax=Salix koriyanagi TaxID=2511006 RepID=A0A9Q0WF26_9ROSI|nr:RNA AND EXPORT FACTOR BINDING PROTEIN [Salix koriyanagi]